MRSQSVYCVLGGVRLSSSKCAGDPLDESGEVHGEHERIETSGIARLSCCLCFAMHRMHSLSIAWPAETSQRHIGTDGAVGDSLHAVRGRRWAG